MQIEINGKNNQIKSKSRGKNHPTNTNMSKVELIDNPLQSQLIQNEYLLKNKELELLEKINTNDRYERLVKFYSIGIFILILIFIVIIIGFLLVFFEKGKLLSDIINSNLISFLISIFSAFGIVGFVGKKQIEKLKEKSQEVENIIDASRK